VGLYKELRSIAENAGEKRIFAWLLERRFKAKLFAIERDGSLDIANDEEQ
jgi:hypothetical protein